jgi:hypothetical protein
MDGDNAYFAGCIAHARTPWQLVAQRDFAVGKTALLRDHVEPEHRPARELARDSVTAAKHARRQFPLVPYPDALRRASKNFATAENARHHVVEGPDRILRRFPADYGPQAPFGERTLLGVDLQRMVRSIYDPAPTLTKAIHAGYIVDANNASLDYAVGGKCHVAPLTVNSFEAFELAGGKWMVPQPDIRGCSQAAEAMLLAEGKSAPAMREILRKLNALATIERRTAEECIASLHANAGRPPIVKDITANDPQTAVNVFAALIQHGPAMLLGDGHVVVLDAKCEGDGPITLAVREPMQGSYREISDAGRYLGPQAAWPEREHLKLLFLPERPALQPG